LLWPRRKWAIYRPTARPDVDRVAIMARRCRHRSGYLRRMHRLSRLIGTGRTRYDTARDDRTARLMTVVPAVRDVCTLWTAHRDPVDQVVVPLLTSSEKSPASSSLTDRFSSSRCSYSVRLNVAQLTNIAD